MSTGSMLSHSLEMALFEGFGRLMHAQRFLFLAGDALGSILALTPRDVSSFASHWPRLTLDRHMADGGTYRFRRYGQYDAPVGGPRRLLPHAPYEQPTYINHLNGGVPRVFDPLEDSFTDSLLLNRLLDWLTGLCDQCEGAPRHWNIRLHPYRIVAEAGASGNPTPEGLHRDGVDYIVSMLVSRSNVEGGETTITNNDREVLWQRTLQRPLDIMVGLDAQTLHSVTPVTPLDPQRPAWRDVLVVAFTKVQP